jgi:hypothetical protein
VGEASSGQGPDMGCEDGNEFSCLITTNGTQHFLPLDDIPLKTGTQPLNFQ